MSDVPVFEGLIESLLTMQRYGLAPTAITLPSEQWLALHNAMGPLSSAKWQGTPYIRVSGPAGIVEVWEQES